MARKNAVAEQPESELPVSDTNGNGEAPKSEPGKEALQRKLEGFKERLHLMEEANKISSPLALTVLVKLTS